MPHPPDHAVLTIDLDALAHNRAVLAAEAAGAEIGAVVKADGYGLGAGPVARRLYAEGARSFFVARVSEGEALRSELGARDAAIYVLDGLPTGTADRMAAARLIPVISTLPQANAALARAAAMGRYAVALQVDTGMNRQGLTLPEVRALLATPGALDRLEVVLVMSHLGSATVPGEARNPAQLARFREVRALFPGVPASFAASAGAFLGVDYRHDLVRGGVSLYGGGPEERPDGRLKAVATLTAPILDIRNLQPGDRLSYGEVFTAVRAVRAAVVAAGYADGILRGAAGKGYAWAAGARRPLLAVNMDLTIIEIGDAPLAPGESVELLGPNVLIDDLATAAGTVAHEILVRLSRRAERVYLGDVA
ncbi:alanine racemase [Phenylobacterium kunshanense]|uniref:Alanine racemase n=1 Tax=Phenylobacterium kunshanense TaxID=1445034 RepID=A0A328BSP1_9CAUL|nr:alanine racemase [Phenylobacterium kunshanense]RAK69026.1 alanine racemase [Phenylobacterium kunshanense]